MSETLAISPKRKAFYQALWSRWLIVLMIVFDLQRVRRGPVATETVAAHMPIRDLKTVRGYLRDLDTKGLLSQVYTGRWLLTDRGVQTLERAAGWIVQDDSAMDLQRIGGEIPLLIEEEDSRLIKLNHLDSDSSSSSEGGNPPSEHVPWPGQPELPCTLQEILDAVPLLFGKPVAWKVEFADCSAADALGHVTMAWQERERLHNPIGMIVKRLMGHEHPHPMLFAQYLDTLPNDFLAVLRLAPYRCAECGQEFGADRVAFKAHVHEEDNPKEDVPMTPRYIPDETVLKVVNGCSIQQAWDLAKGQLQMEMPKASFDTWVRDSIAAGWDADAQTIRIGARNAYARDWLENRLTSTAERLLFGILNNASITLEFVVAVEARDNDGNE